MMVDLKVMAYFKLSLSTHNWDRAIDFGKVGLDIAGRHTASIEGDNAVIKTLQLLLALFDQLWLEGAIVVTRHPKLDVTVHRANGLGTLAIARVAGVLAMGCMLGIAEMGAHFRVGDALGDTLGQLLEQTTFAENIFRAGAALAQLVDKIVWYWHSVVPFNRLLRMPLTQSQFFTSSKMQTKRWGRLASPPVVVSLISLNEVAPCNP
jgi:hypothetical protein